MPTQTNIISHNTDQEAYIHAANNTMGLKSTAWISGMKHDYHAVVMEDEVTGRLDVSIPRHMTPRHYGSLMSDVAAQEKRSIVTARLRRKLAAKKSK